MWIEHDNKFHDKHHNNHDGDVDINININVDNDRDCDFDHMGGRIGGRRDVGLNLCDVTDGIKDVAGSIGEGAVADAIRQSARVKEEPLFIDCQWDRLLDRNKEEMLLKSARMSAALKDSQG